MGNNKLMKKYKIYCWRTYRGIFEVEAKSEKEADLKADEFLLNGGEMDERIPPDVGIWEIEELKQ